MKTKGFLQRKRRVRAKVSGTADAPRISVFRSNKGIYAQLIDDIKGITIVSASTKEIKAAKGKIEASSQVGEALAKKALAKKVKKAVFDKGGYRYHGRVKSLADGARKGGLVF